MKKIFLIFVLICLANAKNFKDYNIGEELNDKQGVKYFEEFSKRPIQQWPIKNLSIDDAPKGEEGKLIRYGI